MPFVSERKEKTLNFIEPIFSKQMNNNLDGQLRILMDVVEKGFGEADLDTIDRCVNEDVVEHQFGRRNGREVLKQSINAIAQGFSKRNYELIQHAVSGDRVWVHYRFTAIHDGPFFGHEATGNKVVIDIMDIAVIKNNQIVEHWGIPDRFALLMQIGALQMNK